MANNKKMLYLKTRLWCNKFQVVQIIHRDYISVLHALNSSKLKFHIDDEIIMLRSNDFPWLLINLSFQIRFNLTLKSALKWLRLAACKAFLQLIVNAGP